MVRLQSLLRQRRWHGVCAVTEDCLHPATYQRCFRFVPPSAANHCGGQSPVSPLGRQPLCLRGLTGERGQGFPLRGSCRPKATDEVFSVRRMQLFSPRIYTTSSGGKPPPSPRGEGFPSRGRLTRACCQCLKSLPCEREGDRLRWRDSVETGVALRQESPSVHWTDAPISQGGLWVLVSLYNCLSARPCG